MSLDGEATSEEEVRGVGESDNEEAEMDEDEKRQNSSHKRTNDHDKHNESKKPSNDLEASLIISDWDEDATHKGSNTLESTISPAHQGVHESVSECQKDVNDRSNESAKLLGAESTGHVWQGEETEPWKSNHSSNQVGVGVVGSRREDVVTVKLEAEVRAGVRNEGVLTRAWELNAPLGQLRRIVSTTTKVPLPFVQLVLDDIVLNDEITLTQLDIVANATVHMCVRSTSPGYPLVLPPSTPPPPTPDVITVTLMDSDGTVREVVVEVVWSKGCKDWLGGYRHRTSGKHYHHAATQTQSGRAQKPGPESVSRGIQTYSERSLGVQTNIEAATQTSDLYPLVMTPHAPVVTPTPPKEDTPNNISLGEERASLQENTNLCTTQSDNHQDGKRIDPRPSDISHQIASTKEHLPKMGEEVKSKQKRQHLLTFSELYERLQEWHRKEAAHINSTLEGPERKQALVALLGKEIELLRSLEAQRAARSAKRKEKATDRFLKEVSRAQVWDVRGGGGHVTVETPATAPTRELSALAADLLQDADPKVRAHQFIRISHTVQTFQPSCHNPEDWHRTAQELVDLSIRGVELSACGTPDSRLRGLRMRIHSHLLHLLRMVQGHSSSAVIKVRSIRSAGAKPLLVIIK
ncbi:IQ motif and ubiquitin-like domain-containing protein [Oratosquilla oratoria]|uniref:IQ motif and ubiquitin-like domain-containing protein n=1 Tax=Oratosquilla oratoria TaxID=337810 RepID=UPI003F777F13